jgi:hypothetical protein
LVFPFFSTACDGTLTARSSGARVRAWFCILGNCGFDRSIPDPWDGPRRFKMGGPSRDHATTARRKTRKIAA